MSLRLGGHTVRRTVLVGVPGVQRAVDVAMAFDQQRRCLFVLGWTSEEIGQAIKAARCEAASGARFVRAFGRWVVKAQLGERPFLDKGAEGMNSNYADNAGYSYKEDCPAQPDLSPADVKELAVANMKSFLERKVPAGQRRRGRKRKKRNR